MSEFQGTAGAAAAAGATITTGFEVSCVAAPTDPPHGVASAWWCALGDARRPHVRVVSAGGADGGRVLATLRDDDGSDADDDGNDGSGHGGAAAGRGRGGRGGGDNGVKFLTATPDGAWLLAVGGDCTLRMWNAATWR